MLSMEPVKTTVTNTDEVVEPFMMDLGFTNEVSIYNKDNGKVVLKRRYWDRTPRQDEIESFNQLVRCRGRNDCGMNVGRRRIQIQVGPRVYEDWKEMCTGRGAPTDPGMSRKSRMNPIVLAIVKHVIEDRYLTPHPASAREIWAEVQQMVQRVPGPTFSDSHIVERTNGMKGPSLRTIYNCLGALDQYMVAEAHLGRR